MYTTLNKIKAHSPCVDGWTKLLKNLGKTTADDEPLAITTILESNGLNDALWCLRAVDGHQREMRLFAVECARSVQHLMFDQRSISAIDVAERHANGLATDAELAAELAAARAATTSAATDSETSAATAAATAAATSSARDAEWAAASAAASASASAASWDAAAMDAAWAVVKAAASAAAWDAQANFLILVCEGAFDETTN